jgi:hypothetical protein
MTFGVPLQYINPSVLCVTAEEYSSPEAEMNELALLSASPEPRVSVTNGWDEASILWRGGKTENCPIPAYAKPSTA